MSDNTTTIGLATMLAVLACSACDIAPIEPDAPTLGALALITLVTPGDSLQLADIRGFGQPLEGLIATMSVRGRGGPRIVTGETPPQILSNCAILEQGAFVGAWACRLFRVPISPGDTVTVSAYTPSSDTVSGSTVVPGSFRVQATRAGPTGIQVAWDESPNAFSYLVAVYDDPACSETYPCAAMLVRRVLGRQTILDTGNIRGRNGAYVTVYALDRNLDVYATTGVAGGSFSTLPISSVHGGLGMVGARVRGEPSRVYLDP